MIDFKPTTKQQSTKIDFKPSGGFSKVKKQEVLDPKRGMLEGALGGVLGSTSRISGQDVPGITADLADAMTGGTLRPTLKRPMETMFGGPGLSQFTEGAEQVKERPLDVAQRLSMFGPSSLLTNQPSQTKRGIDLPRPKTFSGQVASIGLQAGMGMGANKLKQVMTPTPEKHLTEAQKLTSELMQPSKSMTQEFTERGEVAPVIREGVRNIKQKTDFKELIDDFRKTMKDVFDKRHKILSSKNFDINNRYVQGASKDLSDMLKKGKITQRNYEKAIEVLDEERNFLKGRGNKIDRVSGTERKTDLGTLARKAAGDPKLTDPGTNAGYEVLRRNLKQAVEAGDPEVARLNSQFEGIQDSIEALSSQSDVAKKLIPPKWYERALPIVFAPKKFGALSQTVGEIAEMTSGFPKKTKKIAELYQKGASADKPFSYQAPSGVRTYQSVTQQPPPIKGGKPTVKQKLYAGKQARQARQFAQQTRTKEVFGGMTMKQLPSPRKMLPDPGPEPFVRYSEKEASALRSSPEYQKFASKLRFQEMGPGTERTNMALKALEEARKKKELGKLGFRGKVSYENR